VTVRQELVAQPRPRRGIEERLVLRFPRAARSFAAAIWRLPVRSRVRQAVVRRAVTLGWEAMNRVDLDVGLALYHPDVESVVDPAFASIGFDNHITGRDARMANLLQVYREFREFRFYPEEIVYLDHDHLLVVGRMRGIGLASGATFDTEWANLWTFSAGLVTRDEVFRDRAEAFRTVGLTPPAPPPA
jgi:ketosteroid isomerase-like protein